VFFAEAGESVNPPFGKPSHELRASRGAVRAADAVVVNLNQRPSLFPIHKANCTVRSKTTFVAMPHITD